MATTRKPTDKQAGTPVVKVGNLTRDPELAYSTKGNAWAKFSIAVNPWVRDAQGGHRGDVQYYDCRAFGTTAENLAESAAKGDRLIVSGLGSVEEYTKKDGTAGSSKVIVCNDVGIDLRYSTLTINKAKRTDNSEPIVGSDGEVIDF